MTYQPGGWDERTMRDDLPRTGAYEIAISKYVRGRIVLDLGTGSLALLALKAVRAGASHVYALEARPPAAAMAREAVAAAGLQHKITVLQNYSTRMSTSHFAHGLLDLLLHEILGPTAGSEGAVVAVRDAARRLLQPPVDTRSVRSIPSWAASLLGPTDIATSARRDKGAM